MSKTDIIKGINKSNENNETNIIYNIKMTNIILEDNEIIMKL